jgi:streptogramin lyase
MPRGIHIDGADRVWITDRDYHTVTRFAPDGTAELVLGRKLAPSPTCDGRVAKSRPFNMPTNVATTPDGEMFAADGYGNHKVHRFAPDGTLLLSWGRQGTTPGTFALVHNVALDSRGRVFTCDDENDRIQIFTGEGAFLDEWRFANPSGICIRDDIVFVSELRPFRDAAICPGRCRVSLWTLDGTLLADWRGADGPRHDPMRGGHDLCVDAAGDIYLCEGNVGRVVKFRRT